jgi:predicted metal-binding protein
MKLKAHLFVCTHTRGDGTESCGAKGSTQLRDQVKACGKDPSRGWKGKVRVNASGCLGQCEKGIVAVLYPEGKWMTDLKPDDSDQLSQAIDFCLAESRD